MDLIQSQVREFKDKQTEIVCKFQAVSKQINDGGIQVNQMAPSIGIPEGSMNFSAGQFGITAGGRTSMIDSIKFGVSPPPMLEKQNTFNKTRQSASGGELESRSDCATPKDSHIGVQKMPSNFEVGECMTTKNAIGKLLKINTIKKLSFKDNHCC